MLWTLAHTQSKLELLMFFEFDHKGNGIFYNVIFREEGIMNIIHYDQGVSNETDRCRKNIP